MPRVRVSEIMNSIGSALPHFGGSSTQARSRSKAPADPDLAQWMERRKPSENRAAAVKTLETVEKYRRTKVDLSRLGLEELPAKVSSLVATKELDLSNNQLRAWPAQLAGLGNLEHLNVSVNTIGAIPAEIAFHTKLESLNARSNCIGTISGTISRLRCLRELDLSHNKLKQVPAEILGLSELKKLSLAANDIETLPAMDRWYRLKELDLSKNPLRTFPDGPDNPEAARRNGQQPAAMLPAGLEKLDLTQTELEDLHVSFALPEHVGKLKELKSLDVSGNPLLYKLPLGFGSFKTAGTDEVVSVVSPERTTKLTVSYQGTGVADGLKKDGRLIDGAGRDHAGRSDTSARSTEGNDLDGNARRHIRQQRRQARAGMGLPPGNGPLPGTGGTMPPMPPAPTAGMYGNASGMAGFQPTMPAQVPGAGHGVYPPPAGTSAPYTYPPAAPNAGAAFPQAWAGGAAGAPASTSAAGLQTPQVAAGPTSHLPGMPLPGFGPQTGAVDPQTWFMQLGVQMYVTQLQVAAGLAPQPVGQAFMPGGAGQAFGATGAQQAAIPAWAPAQAAGTQLPPSMVYDGMHAVELRNRNFGILRNQQMLEVCRTIPGVMSERGIDERVLSIKAEVRSMGLNEHQTRDRIGNRLVELGAGLWRQRMVDEIARDEALQGAAPHVDAHTRSIAFQTFLAEPLNLPGPIMGLVKALNERKMRDDLFEGAFPEEVLKQEGERVLDKVRLIETSDFQNGHRLFNKFLNEQKFWQEHSAQESEYLRNALYANLE